MNRNLTLFATGDFVRCDIKGSWYGLGRVGLIIGMMVEEQESGTRMLCVVIGQEGNIGFVDIDDVTTAYVYDPEVDLFIDKDAKERALRLGLSDEEPEE